MTEAMKILQGRIGAAADGNFGPNTARAIVDYFGLNRKRGAHLLGQAAHESGMFRLTRENLNYSAESMMRVWPKRFPTMESAAPYARNPEALANKVYSNRMGNGDNEGALWVGRGFIQLTGKANYRSFASDMGLPDVMTDPDLVATEYAFESAMWFFESNGLFEMADDGVNDSVITSISKRVNGGTHGLDDRMEQTKKIHSWIAHVGV